MSKKQYLVIQEFKRVRSGNVTAKTIWFDKLHRALEFINNKVDTPEGGDVNNFHLYKNIPLKSERKYLVGIGENN